MKAKEPSTPEPLWKLQHRCAADLTRWLANSTDFRADYDELRSFAHHLHWSAGLTELDEDKPSPEHLDKIERMFLEMIEQAPSRLQPHHFGAWKRPNWELELFGELRREWLPLTDVEADHYGPD